MMIEQMYSPSLWVHLLVWPPLSILATFFRYHVKGAVMGWMWWLGIRGGEQH